MSARRELCANRLVESGGCTRPCPGRSGALFAAGLVVPVVRWREDLDGGAEGVGFVSRHDVAFPGGLLVTQDVKLGVDHGVCADAQGFPLNVVNGDIRGLVRIGAHAGRAGHVGPCAHGIHDGILVFDIAGDDPNGGDSGFHGLVHASALIVLTGAHVFPGFALGFVGGEVFGEVAELLEHGRQGSTIVPARYKKAQLFFDFRICVRGARLIGLDRSPSLWD